MSWRTTDRDDRGSGSSSLADLNRHVLGDWRRRTQRLRQATRDLPSYWHLARHRRWADLSNFHFTKRSLPTGEGFFHAGDTRLIGNPDAVGIPQYVEIETTTICNKRCFICEYVHWDKDEQVRRHLSFDEFRHMADQFPPLRWVNLTGEGSAFLNPAYPRMIRYLWERHRTSVWLVDHLDDLTTEQLERDILPYVTGIYVSMDGATRATYEGIKAGCNFDRVVSNLKTIIEYKRRNRTPFPHLCFRYVILRDNVHEIPAFLELLDGLARPHEWGGSTSIVEFTGLLYFDEIRDHYVDRVPQEVVDALRRRRGRGIRFWFSHAEEERNPPIEECAAWLEPYVMLPGYVVPCCAVMMSNNRPHLRRYAFGNLFRNNLREVWNSAYYRHFRRILNDPTQPVPRICAGCRAYRTRERIARNGIWDVHDDPTFEHRAIEEFDLGL